MVQIQPTNKLTIPFIDTTNGSWWGFRIQPNHGRNQENLESHHGSWWMVQIHSPALTDLTQVLRSICLQPLIHTAASARWWNLGMFSQPF
jgi:hypothetical protein